MGSDKVVIYIMLGLALVFLADYAGWIDLSSHGTPEQPNTPASTGGDCIGIEDTTVTITLAEQYNPTTKATGGYAYKIKNAGNAAFYEIASDKVSGDQLTLSPGDQVELIYAGNATSSSSTGWASEIFSFEVPCQGTYQKQIEVYDITSTPLTIKAFNSAYSQIVENGATCESIGVGGTGSIDIEAQGTFEDTYGIDKALLCVEYNKTAYDSVELSGGKSATKPAHLDTAAGYNEDCWEFPSIVSNAKLKTTLAYQADEVNQPDAVTGNMTFTFVDRVAYRDDNTLEYTYGYEDENSNDIGISDDTAVMCAN